MKKLFMFLAVAGLATFGASCSSDDGGTPPPPDKVLTAKASPSTVEVNKEVTFSATSEGKAVDGVSFYSGETKLNNPHKFDTKGTYKVVAKKEGFKDSAAITVTVNEAGNPGDGDKKTLTLTIAPAEVTLGQSVTFMVMEGTANVTASSKISVNGTEITGDSYTATAVGTYSVVAKKEGANDSAEKTFEVTEPVAGNSIVSNGTNFVVDNTIVRSFMTADRTAYQAFRVALDPNNPEVLTFVTHWIMVTHSGDTFGENTQNYTYVEVYVPANEAEGMVIFPGDAAAEYYVVTGDDGAIVEAVVDGDFAPVMYTLNGFGMNVDEFVRADPSTINYMVGFQGTGEDLLEMTYSGDCDFGLIPYVPEPAARGVKASKFSLNNNVSKMDVSKKINKKSAYKLNLNLVKVN